MLFDQHNIPILMDYSILASEFFDPHTNYKTVTAMIMFQLTRRTIKSLASVQLLMVEMGY